MHAVYGYAEMSEDDLRQELVDAWTADEKELNHFDILFASGDLGGYEESAWFLLRNRESGELFEVSGSHCSCYGFEGQFKPAPTTHKYLLSNLFYAYSVDQEIFQTWFLEYAEARGELPLAEPEAS